tara:strand:- start:1598 stop:1945 length:348 start_codon:yes stop_codon:yes gene_type:complete
MDTLDTLSNKIQSVSDDPVIQKLVMELTNWKKGDENVKQLESTIERFIGTTWIKEDEHHEQVYQLWSAFRDENIRLIQGMTMNERLFSFGLFERYDDCRTKLEKDVIYKKLLGSR